MVRYIVDVNLPDHFSLWHTAEFIYVKDLDPTWVDTTIWEYARQHELTIITKDRDFYNRMLLSVPPPRVVHIRCGNLRIRDFYQLMHRVWADVLELNEPNKMVLVYSDHIEAIN